MLLLIQNKINKSKFNNLKKLFKLSLILNKKETLSIDTIFFLQYSYFNEVKNPKAKNKEEISQLNNY